MKSYKDFEKKFIGSSDIAALTVRSVNGVFDLRFGEDGCYDAYICYDDIEIPSHYTQIFSGNTWLSIYDDDSMTYFERNDGMLVDIYRAGKKGCIIHWH